MRPRSFAKCPSLHSNLCQIHSVCRATCHRGTHTLPHDLEVAVAGKTGTAEYPGPRDAEGYLPTHAWFTAFAPYEEPEIALVVFVSGGHEGAKVAVPIAAQILRAYYSLPLLPSEELVAAPPGD